MENWKKIEGYSDYEVSDKGRIKSFKFGKERILKQYKNKNGYLQIGLWKNGKMKSHSVHRLVANAFIENPENKKCVDHVNGIKTDNKVKNLRFATYSENLYNTKSYKNSSSKYKGVCWHKRNKKWIARYRDADGKLIHIGYFESEIEAHQAYQKAVKELHGEFLRKTLDGLL